MGEGAGMRVRTAICVGLVLIPLGLLAAWAAQWGEGPGRKYNIAATRQLHIGGATLQVDFAAGAMDLPVDTLMQHVQAAASAVATYYGRFPVPRARVLIIPVADKH